MSLRTEVHVQFEKAAIEAVQQAVREAGIGRAASVSRVPVGMSNAVFEVELLDGIRLIARVSSVAKNRYAMEQVVMEKVRAAGIRCPEVLAIQTVGELAVMLVEFVQGTRLGEAATAPNLAGDCGELLARIHSLSVAGCGNLGNSGAGESDSLERWFIDDFEPSLAGAAEAVGPAGRHRVEQVRSDFESSRPMLRDASCALVHGDFSPSNILVEDGQISGIVDWESAKAGPAAFDFGWWDWFEAAFPVPFSGDELLAAYAQHRHVDLDQMRQLRRLVVMRILVGQVAWAASRDQAPELAIALRRLAAIS